MTRFTNLRLKLSLLAVIVALAGASALAQISGSQYVVTSGTQTTNLPVFTATQTWNAGGVAFQGILLTVTNTASAAGAHLLDLVAGAGGATNMFNVDKSGNVTAAAAYTGTAATLTNTTNQIVVGTTNVDTLSFTAPAASRTITFPDPLGADSVAYLAATQTLTNKTITAPVFSGSATGTYTLAGTPTITSPVINGATGNLGGSATAGGFAQTLIDVTQNATPATQTTFFTTNSVTIPASAFNAATRGISCDTWGTTGATADNKNFKWVLGSAAVYTSVASVTLNAKAYWAHLSVVRSGSNTQSGYGSIQFDSPINTTFSGQGQSTAMGQTEGSSIAVLFQANDTSAAASAATGNGMVCTFVN